MASRTPQIYTTGQKTSKAPEEDLHEPQRDPCYTLGLRKRQFDILADTPLGEPEFLTNWSNETLDTIGKAHKPFP
ncbi:MAG: hypothetical protein NXI17_13550 [Alphaproteobacteria bacterium]|nr:hypothetical protein [Alphaproteobacteria bacterium]